MKKTLLWTVAIALLTPAALANANTYDVYSCWAGYGTFHNPNASGAAWTKDTTGAGGHFAARDDCGVNSTSGAMSVTSLAGDLAARGQNAEFVFTAPPGTTLAGASLWRRAWTYGTGTGASSQRNFLMSLADGASLAVDSDGGSDVPYGALGTVDATDHGIVDSNLLTVNLAPVAASRLSYRVGCGFDAGCVTTSTSGPNRSASGVNLFGAIVSITDTTPPSISVGQTGLFDGEIAAGSRPVVVQTAGDASGIKKLAVFADGDEVPVGVADFEEDVNLCNWAMVIPCQNVGDIEIPVDTRPLSDGLHSFVVKAFDAAGNEKTSSTHYVTVKNQADPEPDPTPTPTPPGETPTPTPTPTGPGATDGTGLPNGVSTGTGSTGASPAAGPTLSVAFEHNGKSSLKARYRRMVTLRGRLRDGRGAAIANAQVDYSARVTKAGARSQDLGSVRTDGEGAFWLTVATKLGSRTLRFAYRPQIGGAVATSAQAQLNVIAPLSLRAGPSHVHNKHAVVFSGRLSAGPIPRKGKIVNLQVIVDGHWHTFATVRSLKSGRFKYRYRFMRTYGRVTYRFRALSRYEAAYPFVAGNSNTVRVHVNGCPCPGPGMD